MLFTSVYLVAILEFLSRFIFTLKLFGGFVRRQTHWLISSGTNGYFCNGQCCISSHDVFFKLWNVQAFKLNCIFNLRSRCFICTYLELLVMRRKLINFLEFFRGKHSFHQESRPYILGNNVLFILTFSNDVSVFNIISLSICEKWF